jgi:hypothetical protein
MKKTPTYKKVRIFEEVESLVLDKVVTKQINMLETTKEQTYFFAIYKDKNGKRNYHSI